MHDVPDASWFGVNDGVLAAGAADAAAADEPVLVREEHRQVRRHVAALSALQRQSITLVYFAGLTHTQGAQRLNVPVPTFKSRLRDGLVRLRGLHADSDREDLCA